MIRYALACDAGHRFESWFRDSESFTVQAAEHLVACPQCGSSRVAKTIMAPAIVSGGMTRRADAPAPPSESSSALQDADLRRQMAALRDKVLAGTQDAGLQFAARARAMHDGLEPHQPIRGQATIEQARGLLEDGIPVLPVPAGIEDLN